MHEPEYLAVYEGNQGFDGLPDFGAGAFVMGVAIDLGAVIQLPRLFFFRSEVVNSGVG